VNLEFDASRQREKDLQKLKQKAKTFADSTRSKLRSEVSRQIQLRPPEIDRQLASQNSRQREADRQKQLISPTAKAGGDRFSGSRN